jgi:hypothetical protein
LEVVPFIDSTTPPKTPLLKWLLFLSNQELY